MYHFFKSLNYLASPQKGKKSLQPAEPKPQKTMAQDIALMAVIFLTIFTIALEPKSV
jgi:hypothetical protein